MQENQTMHLSPNGYMALALKTAIYPGKGACAGLIYVALKLAGEAGEFSEHVGKAIRDDGFLFTENPITDGDARWLTEDRRNKLIKEAGDVCWYLAAACYELGISFEDMMIINLQKLRDRQERGALQGSGDDR